MHKQNVKKANKTTKINASIYVVGYTSEAQSRCLKPFLSKSPFANENLV